MEMKTLGFLAGLLTTVSFLPQVVKSLRTRRMEDFNIWFLGLMIIGLALWTIYGFLLKQPPIIIANLATISLNLILLGLKVRYQGRN
jgi:MtN3 and saliva related transmembrane protein